jgi:hypothetical protein
MSHSWEAARQLIPIKHLNYTILQKPSVLRHNHKPFTNVPKYLRALLTAINTNAVWPTSHPHAEGWARRLPRDSAYGKKPILPRTPPPPPNLSLSSIRLPSATSVTYPRPRDFCVECTRHCSSAMSTYYVEYVCAYYGSTKEQAHVHCSNYPHGFHITRYARKNVILLHFLLTSFCLCHVQHLAKRNRAFC